MRFIMMLNNGLGSDGGEVLFPIVSQWVVVFLCFKYGSHIPTMQCSIFPAFSPRLGGSGCPRHVWWHQRAKKNWNPHLVGGFSPPLWKMMDFVSWDDDIPNIIPNMIPNNYHIPNIYDYSQQMGKKTCSKPPTSQSLWVFFESMSAYWATASSPAAIRVKRLSLVACRETPYLWWGKKTGETPPKMGDLWGIHGISIGSWDMNGIFMGRLGCSWNVNRIYPPVTC